MQPTAEYGRDPVIPSTASQDSARERLANLACGSILTVIVLAMVIVVIRAWPIPWSEGGEAEARFHSLTTTSMEALLSRHFGIVEVRVVNRSFRRNSTGDKLYFQIYHPDSETYSIVVLSSQGPPIIMPTPTMYSYLNDRQEIVAWRTEDRAAVEFADGTRRKLARLSPVNSPFVPHYGAFGMDPGGHYFFLQATAEGTEIGRTEHPRAQLGTVDLALSHLFADGDELLLLGKPIGAKDGRTSVDAVFVRVLVHEDMFEELERISIPNLWFRDIGQIIVFDLDTKTKTLALYGGRDLLPSYNYFFSIPYRTLHRSPSTPGDGLFIQENLRRVLKGYKPRSTPADSALP